MSYYIAVVNPFYHIQEWETLKATLRKSEVAYVVYYDETITQIELNEVTSEVFYQMIYSEN
jgi:hypothetical protein